MPVPTPACFFGAMDPNPVTPEREDRLRSFLERFPDWLLRLALSLLQFFARFSSRRYVLFLEDLAPAQVGDQVGGCTPEVAKEVVCLLARMHAGHWNNPRLTEFRWIIPMNQDARFGFVTFRGSREAFFREFGRRLPPHANRLADWLDANAFAMVDHLTEAPFTLVHGDYRLDNLFFGENKITVADWQGAGRGSGAIDLAYFVSGNLDPELAEKHEKALIASYHEALLDAGINDYPLEKLTRDYQLSLLLLAYRMIAGMQYLDLEGERGQELLERAMTRLFLRVPDMDFDQLL